MKHTFLKSLALLLIIFVVQIAYSQQQSGQATNTVNFKVTYDPITQLYTSWVVPNYNVPNINNTGTTEKGATAQFTLVVPKNFIITNITDVKGVWEKAPLKLGPGQAGQDWSAYPALDPNYNYYVIGKTPSEADYGTFVQNTPVALFTFQGNGCFGPVLSIPNNSPFIFAADDNYSLGVENSFYSRSGQPAGGNQNPLEQFNDVSGGPANCDNTPIVLANPENATTLNGSPITISVLGNDKINGNPVSITDVNLTIQEQPTNGTLTVNPDGTIKYTPTGTFTGTDCYVYKICDKMLATACDTSKVCVTVQAPIAPVLVANPETVTTPNGTQVTTSVLGNDKINGNPVVITDVNLTIQEQPTNGTLTVNPDGTIKYTPTGTFSGTDCYVYKICSKTATTACDTSKVCVTVQAPLAPVLVANPESPTTPNGSPVTTSVLGNDKINGNPVLITDVNLTIQEQPTNGTLTVNPDGTIKYTPTGTFTGTDCYVYKICSKTATTACDTSKVCVTVQAPLAPVLVANPESPTTPNGSPVTTSVLGNDKINGNPVLITDINLTIQEQPTNGTLTVNPDGTIKYTPTGTFSGTDCYVYKICSKTATTACDTSKVCVTVQAPIAPKVIYAFDDNNITSINQTVNGDLLANDKIGTGTGPLVVTTIPVQQPQHGTVVISANGTYSYTPTTGYSGNDTFQYRICDSSTPTICDNATVSINIQPALSTVNNSPIALSDNVITKLNTTVSGNVTLNDKDPDSGQTLITTIVNSPTNGSVTLNSEGTYSYVPNTGFIGNDRFTYKVCDNGSPVLCDEAEVNISINEPNSSNLPPIANDDINLVKPSTRINGNVVLNDTDPNGGGVLTIKTTPLISPTKGTLTLNSDGTFSYLPNAGFTGIDKFVYEVCNNQIPAQCSQATVFLAASSTVGTSPLTSDIRITKKVDKSTVALNEVITYTIVAKNLGTSNATNIIVKDSLGTGLTFVSATANNGSFSNSLWLIPALNVGDSAVLTLSARVAIEGISFNYAKLISLTQTDLIKSNNEASVCVSVPINLCTGNQIQLNAPANYSNVVWYKNGTQVGTGSQITVGTSGSYTVSATNSTCPATGCCPVIVVVADCCQANICVPVTIVRKR